eukprot:scaffold1262_cov134-Pinguiococcus_pyrenoidosus.AAC.2
MYCQDPPFLIAPHPQEQLHIRLVNALRELHAKVRRACVLRVLSRKDEALHTSAAVSCANALSHLDFRRYTLAWAMASFLLRERIFGDRRQKTPRTIKCSIVGSVLVTYF